MARNTLKVGDPSPVSAPRCLLLIKSFACLWQDFISTHWPTFLQVLSCSPELLFMAAFYFLPARSHGEVLTGKCTFLLEEKVPVEKVLSPHN